MTEAERSAMRRDYIRAWKAENRERCRAYDRKSTRPSRSHSHSRRKSAAERGRSILRRRARCRAIVDEVKLSRGCADCGYRAHAIALDFDHLPGCVKSANVARLARTGSVDRLTAEIAKCEVVCANCHRVRTLERGEHRGEAA